MSMIQVRALQLRNEAANLQGLNQELKNLIHEMEMKEFGMQNMWEGQAKEAFHIAFMKDKEQMIMFQNLVMKYIQALYMIAAKYEQVEAQNIEIASKRAY